MVSNTAATSTSPELTNGLGAYIHGIYEYSDFFAATQISLKNIVSNLQSAVCPLGLSELHARHTLGCTSHRRTVTCRGQQLWFRKSATCSWLHVLYKTCDSLSSCRL